MRDDEEERPETTGGSEQSGEDLKEDFESEAATNPEKGEDDPTTPEGLRGG